MHFPIKLTVGQREVVFLIVIYIKITTSVPVERQSVVSHGKETVILKTFLARHQELLTVTSDK